MVKMESEPLSELESKSSSTLSGFGIDHNITALNQDQVLERASSEGDGGDIEDEERKREFRIPMSVFNIIVIKAATKNSKIQEWKEQRQERWQGRGGDDLTGVEGVGAGCGIRSDARTIRQGRRPNEPVKFVTFAKIERIIHEGGCSDSTRNVQTNVNTNREKDGKYSSTFFPKPDLKSSKTGIDREKPSPSTHYTRPTGPDVVSSAVSSCSKLPPSWSSIHDRFIAYLATHAPLDRNGEIPVGGEGEKIEWWDLEDMVKEVGLRFGFREIKPSMLEKRLAILDLVGDNDYFKLPYGVYKSQPWGKGI